MDVRVREMYRLLTPILDEYSLELLEVAMMEEDWTAVHSMALEAAAHLRFDFPAELLQSDPS